MTKQLIGYPSILPGRYTGLERITPSLFKMFKTLIKGPVSTSTKVTAGSGAIGGIALGYDDDHKQYVREGLHKVGIEFPQGINTKGDSIYNSKHDWENVIRHLSERLLK